MTAARIAELEAEVARVISESKRFAEDVAVQIAALMATTAQLRPWSIALQDLTPGGSEFQTPEACLAYARDVRDRQLETIKNFMRRNRTAEARVKELEAVRRACADALTVADRLIERGYGTDTPNEWHRVMRQVQKAVALLSPKDKRNG